MRRTLMLGTGRSWGMYAALCAISRALSSSTGLPSNSTCPPMRCAMPRTARSSVLLPQPFGPAMRRDLPGRESDAYPMQHLGCARSPRASSLSSIMDVAPSFRLNSSQIKNGPPKRESKYAHGQLIGREEHPAPRGRRA